MANEQKESSETAAALGGAFQTLLDRLDFDSIKSFSITLCILGLLYLLLPRVNPKDTRLWIGFSIPLLVVTWVKDTYIRIPCSTMSIIIFAIYTWDAIIKPYLLTDEVLRRHRSKVREQFRIKAAPHDLSNVVSMNKTRLR